MSKKSSKEDLRSSAKAMLQKHVQQLQKDLQTLQGKALHLGKNTFYLSLGVLDSLKSPFESLGNVLRKRGKTASEHQSKKLSGK